MNTLIVGDLNMSLSAIDKSLKKINKETRTLNDTLDQMDFIGIYRTFHPKTTEHSFFSSTHHKPGVNRYLEIEIIPCIFSDHNALKLELSWGGYVLW